MSRLRSRLTTWDTLATEFNGRPFEISGKRDADDRSDAVLIQGMTLDNQDWPSISRARAGEQWQICPPDIALPDYHSTRSRIRCAVTRATPSVVSSLPISLRARFIASVTSSGEWRTTCARTAFV